MSQVSAGKPQFCPRGTRLIPVDAKWACRLGDTSPPPELSGAMVYKERIGRVSVATACCPQLILFPPVSLSAPGFRTRLSGGKVWGESVKIKEDDHGRGHSSDARRLPWRGGALWRGPRCGNRPEFSESAGNVVEAATEAWPRGGVDDSGSRDSSGPCTGPIPNLEAHFQTRLLHCPPKPVPEAMSGP